MGWHMYRVENVPADCKEYEEGEEVNRNVTEPPPAREPVPGAACAGAEFVLIEDE